MHGCRHTIIPDRIEAGTYLIMAAAMGDGVIVDNVIPQHLESLIAKLREMGVPVEEGDDRDICFPGGKVESRGYQNISLSWISDRFTTTDDGFVDEGRRNEHRNGYNLYGPL